MISYLLPWFSSDYATLPTGRKTKAKRIAIALWISIAVFLGGVIGLTVYLVKRNSSTQVGGDWRSMGEECAQAPSSPGDRRKDKDHLRVVTFNTEWLFMDGGSKGLPCPSAKCSWKDKAEAEEHLKAVAHVISQMDADIINVVEVESCRTLARMLSHLPEGHGYRPYVIRSTDTSTGQTLGLLTRVDPVETLQRSTGKVSFPLQNSQCPAAGVSGKTGSTKHYVTRFEMKNSAGKLTSFVMAGAHLLSQPLDKKRCPRREGQASVIREAVEKATRPGDKIIILGDLNDTDNAVQTPGGAVAISGVLPILRGTGGKQLLSVADKLNMADRYSAWWDANGNCVDDGGKEHSLIDHILVSSDWTIESAKADHSYSVSCAQRVSDHWPLEVTFKV